ncbi:hypothetical protein BGP_6389 [Beggiatoa sp. PS]|nr:hypothetical protein BGP_6389 [Beggiatoa sp. PS]
MGKRAARYFNLGTFLSARLPTILEITFYPPYLITTRE